MREVKVGSQNYTKAFSTDAIGPGNAYHEYTISVLPESLESSATPAAHITFQKGPIKIAGRNGCHNEDLIAIVIDRLQCFQSSPYSCRENALALTKLEEALHWLKCRTESRRAKGIEGTHEV